MSEKGSRVGCVGCLGSLVVFTFIGSLFFGGGVHMRVGQWNLAFGHPMNTNHVVANYLADYGSKAKIADEAVQQFHAQFNEGKCQEIYEQAAEVLKSHNSKSDIVASCTNMKSNFGSVESSELIDWWGQPEEQGGSYILTRYNTKSPKFTAQEIFIWLVKDGKPQLARYQIGPMEGSSSLNPTPPNLSPSPSANP